MEVVRWARDPWRTSERMGRLRGANGELLVWNEAMVDGLVGDVFGQRAGVPEPWVRGGLRVGFPYAREEVRQ